MKCEAPPRCVNEGREWWWYCGWCGKRIAASVIVRCPYHRPQDFSASAFCATCSPNWWEYVPTILFDPFDPRALDDWLTYEGSR